MNAVVPVGSSGLVPQDMDQAVRIAKAMSTAKLVPKHLQEDVGSCLMIVDQAMRWRMSPLAVAQCTSVISGKLMYEGKLVAAAVECSGIISGGFDYKFDGDGENRTITVSAVRVGEKEPRTITIRLGDVKTSNEWWKKQPDQQLVYSGTRNWARRWAPAVILGVYAPEEFDRQSNTMVADTGPVIEHEPEAPSPREQINAEVPMSPPAESTPKEKTMPIRVWLDAFEAECAKVSTEDDANDLLDRPDILKVANILVGSAKARYETVKAAMLNRIYTVPPDEDSAAEPEPDEADMQLARAGA
jgi:hypothetical protein